MYLDNGAPVVERGMNKKGLKRAINRLQDREVYIHLRYRTAGEVNLENTHPFEVIPGIYLMHNGVINIACNQDPKRSDTWHFAELVLKPILLDAKDPHDMLRNGSLLFLIEQYTGSGNRFVLFDKFGGVVLNEEKWHTIPNGMRISNTYAWSNIPGLSYSSAFKSTAYEPASFGSGKVSDLVGEELGSEWDFDSEEDIYRRDQVPFFDIHNLPPEVVSGDLDKIETFVMKFPNAAAEVLESLERNLTPYGLESALEDYLEIVTNDPTGAARLIYDYTSSMATL